MNLGDILKHWTTIGNLDKIQTCGLLIGKTKEDKTGTQVTSKLFISQKQKISF